METSNQTNNHRTPLIAAGIFLGLGLGGFIDGILLHQILQWHHMLSSIQPLIPFLYEDALNYSQGYIWYKCDGAEIAS